LLTKILGEDILRKKGGRMMSNSGLGLIDDKVKCSCKGYTLDKLIQPNILIILAKKEAHGYMIIKELENMGVFHDESVDNTGIYRALRTLEEREMIECEWIMEKTGPAKKNYTITEKGKECLVKWVDTLEGYKVFIEKIIGEGKMAIK